MTSKKNLTQNILSLMLLLTILGVTLAHATSEGNYQTDNNFLTNVCEATLTESGYKTNIIINPDAAGIYTTENGYKLDFAIITEGIGGSLKENNYQLDLIPEKTFPDTPDITVTKLATSKTIVGRGYTVKINITISNRALNYQTLHVTVNASTTIINTQTLTLTSKESKIITITWNTSTFTKGTYIISANAQPAPSETNTIDNTLSNCTVKVVMVGDVDANGKVEIKDFSLMAKGYGANYPDPRYVANLDIDGNGKIEIKDFSIAAKNYGKIDP